MLSSSSSSSSNNNSAELKLRVLITGGAGNLSKIILRHLGGGGSRNMYEFYAGIRSNTTHSVDDLAEVSNYAEIINLDLLEITEIEETIAKYQFDVLIHTAILGGRRTKTEDADVFYKNVLMFENILKFADKFKMILNFDSGAIYNRDDDIYARKEDDLRTIPADFYGFSKYVIYKRGMQYDNVFNLRIFNIFHRDEEPDRFIKGCIMAAANNTVFEIADDKYFDFFGEKDFAKVVDIYLKSVKVEGTTLPKTLNLSYEIKWCLSSIAFYIMDSVKFNELVVVKNKFKNETKNYCGCGELMTHFAKSNGIVFNGLKNSILYLINELWHELE